MEIDVIVYGAYALVYIVIAGLLMFAGTKTVEQFKVFIPTLVPWLQRFFDDPASVQTKFVVEQLNIKQAIADAVAEAVAEALLQFAPPAQEVNVPVVEAAPLAESPK